MVDITKLNMRYVDDNGFYNDYDKNEYFRLNDKEIIELRRYHHNMLIAKNRVRVKDTTYKVNVYNKNIIKKRKRFKKYNSRWGIKRWLKRNAKPLTIRCALGVTLTTGLLFTAKGLLNNSSSNEVLEAAITNDKKVDNDLLPSNNKGTLLAFEGEFVNDDKQEIKDIIKKYCDIYNLNYDLVYELLANMTDNFSSDDFYEGRIDGIRCKGREVEADSNEELLIYAIRHIKQIPEDFDLSIDDLYEDSGYVDNSDYFAEIKYYSRIFGLDECLVAAIVQSETGFDSDLFNDYNNPAGLKASRDEWWDFDNKAQGFIELCLEIRKYYSQIGYSHFEVDDDIIALIGDKHAPLSDNNPYWVSNVISNYHMYQDDYSEYFSTDNDKNISL